MTTLDLRAVEARLKLPLRNAAVAVSAWHDAHALLTHCRALRAALQEVEFGGQKAGWTGPVSCCAACYGPRYRNFLGAQSEDVPTYEDAGHKPTCVVGVALASMSDGEAAP